VLSGASGTALGQTALPTIGSTSPLAVAPGKTIDLKIRGGNLAAPTELWTSFPCEVLLPIDLAGNGTKADEVTYRLKLPADAPPGVHGIRVATAQGVSNAKLIAIDDLPPLRRFAPIKRSLRHSS